jgi:hypothetical protein
MIGKPCKLREPPEIDLTARMTAKLKAKIAKKSSSTAPTCRDVTCVFALSLALLPRRGGFT